MIFNLVVGCLGIGMNAVTLSFKFRLSKEERRALGLESKHSIIKAISFLKSDKKKKEEDSLLEEGTPEVDLIKSVS